MDKTDRHIDHSKENSNNLTTSEPCMELQEDTTDEMIINIPAHEIGEL